MDGAAYAAARRQLRVGGVDDGVHVEGRDVALDDLDVAGHAGIARRKQRPIKSPEFRL